MDFAAGAELEDVETEYEGAAELPALALEAAFFPAALAAPVAAADWAEPERKAEMGALPG